MTTQLEETLRLAEGAYSEPRYAHWPAVAKALLDAGYSPREAAATMLSKNARHAADHSDAKYGHATGADLIKYIGPKAAFQRELDYLVEDML